MTESRHDRQEFTGKTIEDCLAAAAASLGVQANDLNVEVLAEPGSLTSLFGKKARIAASVKAPSMADEIADGLRFDSEFLRNRDRDPEPKRNRGRGRDRAPAPVAKPAPRVTLPGDFDPQEALLRIAVTIMPDATVQTVDEDEHLVLDIVGDGTGVFIGRKGTTLEALQFLLNRMAKKRGWEGKRIIVDSEGYRERRATALREKARELADRVLKEKRPLRTEMLDAASRKIVHSEITNFPELRTRSIGEGDRKRVQISGEGDAPPRRRGRR